MRKLVLEHFNCPGRGAFRGRSGENVNLIGGMNSLRKSPLITLPSDRLARATFPSAHVKRKKSSRRRCGKETQLRRKEEFRFPASFLKIARVYRQKYLSKRAIQGGVSFSPGKKFPVLQDQQGPDVVKKTLVPQISADRKGLQLSEGYHCRGGGRGGRSPGVMAMNTYIRVNGRKWWEGRGGGRVPPGASGL